MLSLSMRYKRPVFIKWLTGDYNKLGKERDSNKAAVGTKFLISIRILDQDKHGSS